MQRELPFVSVKCLNYHREEMFLSSGVSGGMKGTLQK